MKILVLHGSSDLYGSGKIILNVTISLKHQGHSVIVLLSEEGPLADKMRKAGAEVRIIRLGILRKKYFTVTGIFNRLKVLLKAFYSIRKIIREEKINLVYSNTTAVLIGAVTARIYRIKHIWHVHEMIVKPGFMYVFTGVFLQHFGMNIIAVSNAVKIHWLKYVEADKIEIIYNGIETQCFENTVGTIKSKLGLNEDIILIGMIGRVNIFKGQDYFLEIAALLKDRYKKIHFILVGDAYQGYEYLYDTINDIIADKKLGSWVTDLGYQEDIPNIMNSLDILVLPSQYPDSFPTVILEAMAAGIPVVATKQGGALEMIVNKETGFIVPLRDANLAAVKLGKLIENSKLRKSMGEKGKVRLHQLFSLETFQKNIVEYVEKIE